MRNKILLGTMLAGVLSAGYALTFAAPTAEAGAPKNLQVYPKNTDKKALKKDMKAINKALDVNCDFCHDMSGFDKDSDMKNKARSMMKMMRSANASLKKNGFKGRVSCNTCHQGAKKPKK